MVFVVLLSGCTRVINSPSDELKTYSWSGEWENGNTAELSFDDDNARLVVHNEAFDLMIKGLCIVTDDSLVICDEESGRNAVFSFILHGDRVELSYNGGKVSLDKIT